MKIAEQDKLSPAESETLLGIWERSVKATHDFLSPAEVAAIKQYVPQAFAGVEHLIIARNDRGQAVGFMGINDKKVEMLFVDANQRGRGVGRQLLEFGIQHYGIDELAVNEQNPQARGFYEHMGFKVVKRSPVDDQGNPYPILEMKRMNS